MLKKSILFLIAIFCVSVQANDFHVIKCCTYKIGEPVKPPKFVFEDITSAAFSPDGTMLASGSYDYTIKIWDTKNWECVQILDKYNDGHTDEVNCIVWGPDGRWLASGSDDHTVNI